MDISGIPTEDLKAEILRRKDNPELHDEVRALVREWIGGRCDADREWISKVFYCGTSSLDQACIVVVDAESASSVEKLRYAVELAIFVEQRLGLSISGYLQDEEIAGDEATGRVEVFSRPS